MSIYIVSSLLVIITFTTFAFALGHVSEDYCPLYVLAMVLLTFLTICITKLPEIFCL